jgi:hypothetical protein
MTIQATARQLVRRFVELAEFDEHAAERLGLVEHLGVHGGDERVAADALVQRHLAMHGPDPARSLAAVSSVSSVGEQLGQIADGDVRASLTQMSPAAAAAPASPLAPDQGRSRVSRTGATVDPYATVGPPAELPRRLLPRRLSAGSASFRRTPSGLGRSSSPKTPTCTAKSLSAMAARCTSCSPARFLFRSTAHTHACEVRRSVTDACE